VRLFQAALEVPVDGEIGPHTLTAVSRADANELILRLSQGQTAFYEADTDMIFKHGQLRRVALRTEAALAMRARGDVIA
jgi:lysozyme family protein